MTATEIKKLYTKTKRSFEKRTGEKHTWVMNAKQQRLGTATVLVACAYDYVGRLHRAEQAMDDFEQRWAEREADYRKRARVEARKNEQTPGWNFGKNDYFWQERSTPEALSECKASMFREYTSNLEAARSNLAKYGDQSKQRKNGIEYAKAIIAGPEVQSFLKAIDGQAVIDVKQERGAEYIYIRFHYTATEA